jgi:hypothetical protein
MLSMSWSREARNFTLGNVLPLGHLSSHVVAVIKSWLLSLRHFQNLSDALGEG